MVGLTLKQLQQMGATPVQTPQPIQTQTGKGFTLEELKSQGAVPVATSSAPVVKSKVLPQKNIPAVIKVINPTFQNKPTLPYTGQEGAVGTVGKAVVNTPKSLFNIAKGTVEAVINPIETAKGVTKLVKGAGAFVGEKLAENTDTGQSFLKIVDQSRKNKGLSPLQKDAQGRLQVVGNEELEMAKGMGEYFRERYGGGEELKRTLIEDPAGLLLDASMFLSGGSTGVAKTANITRKVGMTRTSNILNTSSKIIGETSKFIDPVRQTVNAVKPVAGKVVNNLLNVATKSGKELQTDAVVKGMEGLNQNLKGIKKTFDESSFSVADEINPGKFKKVTPLDTIVEYNLFPEVKDSKVNVDMAKQSIKDNMNDLNIKIDENLKVNNILVDVEGYGKKLEEAINSTNKSQEVKNILKAKLTTYIEQTGINYPGGIPADEINLIRKEANLDYDPTTMDFSRMKGNATREIVYNLTEDQAIKKYLVEQRKLINAEDYIQKIENHAVKGGRLGGYMAKGAGILIGNAIGGAPGAIAGGFLTGKAAEFMQSRQFKSLPADIKAMIEKNAGKEMKLPKGGEIKSIINNKIDQVNKLPAKKLSNPNVDKSPLTRNRQAGMIRIPGVKATNIHPEDANVMKKIVETPKITDLNNNNYRNLELLSERFNISIDKPFPQVKKAFDDVLSGKTKVKGTLLTGSLKKPLPIAKTSSAKDAIAKGLTAKEYVKTKNPNVDFSIYEKGNEITLSKILVSKESRGTGIGTKAMEDLIQYADDRGSRILLTPSKDFGASSVSRLNDFYKRFGFSENKGAKKDFSTKESMIREPKLRAEYQSAMKSKTLPKKK